MTASTDRPHLIPERSADGRRVDPTWRAILNAVTVFEASERRFSDRYFMVKTIKDHFAADPALDNRKDTQ